MLPDARDPTDPEAWLRRARSNLNLATAGSTSPDVLYEDLCFEAQQAAEKAIKAVLVARQFPFPKTQSIGKLIALLSNAGVDAPQHLLDASELTRYATTGRYPGWGDAAERDDYATAVALAEGVLRWAEQLIRGAAAAKA